MFGKQVGRNIYFFVSVMAVVWLMCASVTFGQGTAFTYQGKLNDSGNLANGSYDLQLKLFDTATVGGAFSALAILALVIGVMASVQAIIVSMAFPVSLRYTGASLAFQHHLGPSGNCGRSSVIVNHGALLAT